MEQYPILNGPIGVFDSGYGGLTILQKIKELMPQYDYVYLGDNARAPYGTRSFDVVYEYTKQSVQTLFDFGCPLVILGCNTASAKALKNIQMNDLPQWSSARRVLGVIRPTVEEIDRITESRHVGVLGTVGTIQSESYPIEVAKLYPDIIITGHACPMWVPLVENSEYDSDGADYFVKKEVEALLQKDKDIDTIVLACTHYPLLIKKIKKYVPKTMKIVSQGEIVSKSLENYLFRHNEIEQHVNKSGNCLYYTTESEDKFSKCARLFLDEDVVAKRISIKN